ncbi:serine hydrolase domain-containing protein [Labrys wisconsinensis]|uniref:CubicO group peptidase (Beta-lactamase class C family) n=1 Tax=Labrys wisconsinensis TaxID=425677 RepID=A0ABU0JJY6_9HYPH|nr:serine hydrolase [Labrys wisconsinensis]MDQ0474593.1 CubicO group peptidase (beta-lactamase class C family) [Labrys wisconsinensis]
MTGSDAAPPAGDRPRPAGLTLETWDRPPLNRWSYQHVDEILPTAPVRRGVPAPLTEAPAQLDVRAFAFPDRHGRRLIAGEVLDTSWTDGFLALHRGRIVCEHYANGMRAATPHLTQSLSKSVLAALAGILHHAGAFPLERTVAAYVPAFRDSAYADASMRHLLDMTSGVDFPEDATDPVSGVGLMDIAVGWKAVPAGNPSPRSVHALIASLRGRSRPHGARFEYRSMETEVLGCCIKAATGARLADLVSSLLWQPMGAEHDASFAVDPEGFAVADGGLSATLRDLGRFGLLYARDGAAAGRTVVPEAWVRDTRIGDPALFGGAYAEGRRRGAYRSQFWIDDIEGSVITGLGVFGQMIHIDWQRDFVGVKLSTWPQARDVARRVEACDMMAAMARALAGG